MPSQKKMSISPAAQKIAPAPAEKASTAAKSPKPDQAVPVRTPKTKANAKTNSKANGIQLMQLTGEGQKSNDPVFKAYQPSPGGMGLSKLLDALCIAQRDPALQKSTVWGLLTPDFTQRTGMTGQDLLTVIESNPGFDLYYASADPELEAIHYNPWRSPEATHPEFVEISRRFLKAAGLSDVPVDSTSHSSLFATGHLMVASPEFWWKYVGFVEAVFSQVQTNLN
jgi:hypothetical protein